VDRRRLEVRQLRNVATHEAAIRIEAFGLTNGIHRRNPPRRVAGPCDPLPVPGIAREIAVDQQLPEVLRPLTPVDVHLSREERPRHEVRPVVHPSFGDELAHARIHQREAGDTLLPPVQPVRVLHPSLVPFLVVRARVAGGRRQHL
jgi:hypothetical protein